MNTLSSIPSLNPFTSASSGAAGRTATADDNAGGSEATSQRPSATSESASEQGLAPEELKQLAELKARDREVRAHEAAHQAAGGQHAGAMSFTYQRGPDGAQYAVGGEVSIDVGAVEGNPQATIEKMRTVRAAALAPAEPSGQDRAVAAQAMQTMLQAQAELASEQKSSSSDENSDEEGGVKREITRSGQRASDTYQQVAGMSSSLAGESSGLMSVSA
ncbi:hypothetical protein FWJ25_04100 [Marinobacter salinexigens]|uniref:SprA-related family protein n=1 Tax=Marinobacter salinexigens TaxID=2919747 RepID=A0A5B0VQR9_9GAMM|nr:putative metalloprotease CJM1_0395 family protein [Marinobacter salinexigens]KAA1176321.1 hypothetical protein FWJ25_04100 [Marinobacter salinexigens]